jgi:hypothetical protein
MYIVIRAFVSYTRENMQSAVSQSTDKRHAIYKPNYALVIVATCLLFLEYQFEPFGLAIHSLVIVLLSIYIVLNVASIVLVQLSRILSKILKPSFFKIFQLKYLQTNKHIHQSLRVLFISLVSIVLIFSVRSFMFGEIDRFKETMNFDLALTNIYDYDDELYSELSTYDANAYSEAVFYRNIMIHFNEQESQPVNFLVSMDVDVLHNYFNLDVNNVDEQLMTNDALYVLLPKDFELVYDLHKGSVVNLNLNYLLEDVDAVVAGFLDTNFDNIIYCNIYSVAQYAEFAKPNTIFIKSEHPEVLFQQLVSAYSGKMYYVLDPNVYFSDILEGVSNLTNYFTIFTSYMILCFAIVIFNNTLLIFYALKSDLARLKVLGSDNKLLISSLLKEFIIILCIILVLGFIEIKVLSIYLKNVVLLTNFYKDISSTPLTILYGFILTYIVLLSSYVYYFIKIKNVDIVEEIRIY